MARLLDKEIPDNKNVLIGLTYIDGIGIPKSRSIIFKSKSAPALSKNGGIDPMKKIFLLTNEEQEFINKEFKNHLIGPELKKKVQIRINENIRLGTYKGIRLSRKPNPLPVRGQSTRHNARTAKGGGVAKKKWTVANKKKAPSN